MRRRMAPANEEGATLVLALVFVVIIGLVLLAIISLTGTNLADTANLQNGRALEYSADGAVDAALQAVRYCPVSPSGTFACPGLPTTPCSTSTAFSISTSAGPVNGSNANVVVYCAVAPLRYERQVTFTACPATETLATCQMVHSAGISDAYLVAQVLYTDLATGCSGGSSGCPSVIGQSATVLSWSLQRSND